MAGLFDVLKQPPPHYRNSKWLNRLGLQRIRYSWMNLNRLEPLPVAAEYQEMVDAMAADGIAVIDNFFSEDIFFRLRAEAKKCISSVVPIEHDTTFETVTVANTPTFRGAFASDPRIVAVAHAVSHRPIVRLPTPYIWVHQRKPDAESEIDSGYNSHYAHADKAYPVVKVFYTLDDVDDDNGAFTYYKGSHRLGEWRRQFEFEHSIRQSEYFRRNGHNRHFDIEPDLKQAGFSPVGVGGRANTLVITNTMGFHRRGRFKDHRPRIYGHLDFHYLEWLAYGPYSRLAAMFGRDHALST